MPSEEFVNKYCQDECDCCNKPIKKKKKKWKRRLQLVDSL